MSVSVRVECPSCSTAVVAEPEQATDDGRLRGRRVACSDCGHRIELYYY